MSDWIRLRIHRTQPKRRSFIVYNDGQGMTDCLLTSKTVCVTIINAL